jgi:hypothetical protein
MPIMRCPHIRPLAAPLVLALALSSLLLAAPAVSIAARSGHRPACSAHAKRRSHRCARSGRRRHTRRARHGAARRGAGRAPVLSAGSPSHGPAHPGHPGHTSPAPPPVVVLAICADGSAPRFAAEETFECPDGTEPACEAGSAMSVSDDGTRLLCGAPGEGFELESGCEPGVCEADGGEEGCEAAQGAEAESEGEGCEAPEGAEAEGEGEG